MRSRFGNIGLIIMFLIISDTFCKTRAIVGSEAVQICLKSDRLNMLKLYGGARSRASIVQWHLEELSVPYEFVMLDMAAGKYQQPEFLSLNPMGKVPAIEDKSIDLWKSGAILLYLTERIWSQWVLFGNSTLATGLFGEANREQEILKLLAAQSKILDRSPYLLGEDFSVADLAIGSILAYVPMMLPIDLSPYSVILDYIKRMNQKEACRKARRIQSFKI